MSELRWKWCKPDSAGLWTSGGDLQEVVDGMPIVWRSGKTYFTGWWCRICDEPVILPPEPHRRLATKKDVGKEVFVKHYNGKGYFCGYAYNGRAVIEFNTSFQTHSPDCVFVEES